MDDDQVIGSAAEAKGAVKTVPSLALALVSRPELLPARVSWLASNGKSAGPDEQAPNAVDPREDPAGDK